MSLIGSLLALVAIPLKARTVAPQPPKEVESLAGMALAEEVKRLQFALDHWRNAGNALMAENERLRLNLQDARAQLDPTSPYYQRRYTNAELAMQHQAQMMANYDAQSALGQRMAYQGLGGQHICTCVPARADALTRDFNNGGL